MSERFLKERICDRWNTEGKGKKDSKISLMCLLWEVGKGLHSSSILPKGLNVQADNGQTKCNNRALRPASGQSAHQSQDLARDGQIPCSILIPASNSRVNQPKKKKKKKCSPNQSYGMLHFQLALLLLLLAVSKKIIPFLTFPFPTIIGVMLLYLRVPEVHVMVPDSLVTVNSK